MYTPGLGAGEKLAAERKPLQAETWGREGRVTLRRASVEHELGLLQEIQVKVEIPSDML